MLGTMSTEQNKARALELIDRVVNGHDVAALHEFSTNPAVIASGTGLVGAFPDLEADVRWVVAEGDMVVVFHHVTGTQQGPFLFV
jgi:predicted ester cyclase